MVEEGGVLKSLDVKGLKKTRVEKVGTGRA